MGERGMIRATRKGPASQVVAGPSLILVGTAGGTADPPDPIQVTGGFLLAGGTWVIHVHTGSHRVVRQGIFVAPMPPPPPTPADLAAAMAGPYMHIVWGDVANETTYELQRRQYDGAAWGAWSEPVVRTMNVTSDDQSVVPGTLYQWRIRACNQGGCSAYTSSQPIRA